MLMRCKKPLASEKVWQGRWIIQAYSRKDDEQGSVKVEAVRDAEGKAQNHANDTGPISLVSAFVM